MQIQARFTLSDPHHSDARRMALRTGPAFLRHRARIGAGMIVVGLAVLVARGPLETALGLVGFGALLWVLPLVQARAQSQAWAKDPARGGTLSITFLDDGVRLQGPTGQGAHRWSDLDHIDLTEAALLLRFGARGATYIPLSAFQTPEDAAAVVAQAERQGVQVRRWAGGRS